MDKLAAALGMDPVELRIRNAMAPGHRACRPARSIPEPGAGAPSCSSACARCRCRADAAPRPRATCASCPAASSNTTHGEGVRARRRLRASAFKNVGFSEGFDDYSTARVRLSVDGGGPLVEVHTAAAEVGQGVVTVQAQIARTELGRRARRACSPPTRGSARPARRSASRQTYMTGGAVKAACEAVRERCSRSRPSCPASELELAADARRATAPRSLGDDADRGDASSGTTAPTYPLDENGQGDAHVQFAFSAHRAVVDVDSSSASCASSSSPRRRRSAGR